MKSGTSGPDVAELVILTGMSGAGRSTAANVLEDLGWYVVDNLPPQMMLPMATLAAAHSEDGVIKLAAVIDVRSRRFFTAFRDSMEHLREVGWEPRVIFVDATDEALVRRFESVRRPHPLQGTGRMLDGIIHEREMLGDLRAEADVLIDTSGLNVHQLSAKVSQIFAASGGPRLRLAVMSFGFKYGIPLDADLVFDMRFLPNPFWIPELRPLNGTEPAVSKYVMSRRGAKEFVDRVVELMAPMIDGYQREGRRYVTLAIGCTGGKHRSVAVAEKLAARLTSDDVGTILVHRDLGRE
ncbi:MAG: RNase adapter RapZ [Phycicoccus sp.]|nr:RNase adapter RapZ [Phycicoccus sp.]NMM35683.1 RNase adapter RapZ [Phycicoccus sp.]